MIFRSELGVDILSHYTRPLRKTSNDYPIGKRYEASITETSSTTPTRRCSRMKRLREASGGGWCEGRLPGDERGSGQQDIWTHRDTVVGRPVGATGRVEVTLVNHGCGSFDCHSRRLLRDYSSAASGARRRAALFLDHCHCNFHVTPMIFL